MRATVSASIPTSIAHAPAASNSQRPIVIWLSVVAALVFLMVVVGGVTRLTRSGLSIVEWNPIMGAIPPLTEQAWLDEFAKYQQTPEYQHVNKGMTLAGFKEIFYVEWAHRLLGRMIGLVVFFPLVYFAIRRQISRALIPKVIVMLVLGGLQGAMGWFMVKSGLVDIPRVSAYRLTAHLALAVLIYGYVLWIIFGLVWPDRQEAAPPGFKRMSVAITALVCLLIVAGGFVAGTRAGFVFNTFPLMAGQFIPPGAYAMQPWWINLFENVATVQFNHRILAYALFVAAAVFLWMSRTTALSQRARTGTLLLFASVLAQIGLGIATLLTVVPVSLGALHQAGALVVFTFALYVNHAVRRQQ